MEISTILVAVAAVLISLYYYFTRGHDYFKKLNLPCKKPIPLFGSMWENFFRLQSFGQMVENVYNIDREAKYVGCMDMMTPVFVIRDPDLLKSVTVKHFDHFPDHRSFVTEFQDPLFGKNLFALRGDRWREVRAILSPAFTSSKMKGMFKLMSDCADNFCGFLSNLPADQKEMDIKDAFTRYTNDVIATCAFGVHVDSMKDRDNKFYAYGREATSFGLPIFVKFCLLRSFPKLMNYLGLRIIRKEISDFFMDLVATTIKTRDEKGITRPDMIQLMMETRNKEDLNKSLTIEDMTAQAFVFMFGGFESTATLMCFAAHEIGVNPEIQEKLQEEIDRVLEENNGQVTYEAINSMELLDAIVLETLRMYPSAVMQDRLCAKSFELPPAKPGMDPITLKPGSCIFLPIYGLHYDDNYFEEPRKFDPDRFINNGKNIANSGAYIPFGMGPRMCIGNRFALLETKVLLFHIFARFDMKPCAKTAVPMRLTKKSFVMMPENGFWLNIQPRNKPQLLLATSASAGVSVPS